MVRETPERNITIKIARADGMGGFAAYLAGSVASNGSSNIDLGDNQALILLDVEATFDDSSLVQEGGGQVTRTIDEKRRTLIESLMHEFGHALEDFYDLEFDEGWIESAVMSYAPRGQSDAAEPTT